MPKAMHSQTSSGIEIIMARVRGDDEVIDWVDGERAQSVDLFRYLHRSNFCRHGCADSPRDHERCQNRPEFAAERD